MGADNFSHPLKEDLPTFKSPDPCILVIFGATGDLTARKLVPALYNLAREGQLPAHFACVGFARRDKTHEMFRQEMLEAVNQFSRVKPIDSNLWQTFSEQLYYHRSEFDQEEGYEQLNEFLKQLDIKLGTKGNRVYYLSTQPSHFALITEHLGKQGLIYEPETENKWSRVIIEKPFGHDLYTALQLQKELTKHLHENQIYRIDHYLGKETVQNLLVLRFTNPIFESVWNGRHIDHVQITVSEEIGIGTRGNFFEEAGILRDIVQNHMMQLLSLVAMEPPANLSADSIRDEKVKVMQSVRYFSPGKFDEQIIRGQYGKGFIEEKSVAGYREENNVDPGSNIETYTAMKLYIDNWRWAGTPFFLRAGKRLPKRATEISITFKDPPGFLFHTHERKIDSNILVIRIQPDEGISLRMNCKVPGLESPVQPVKMDFRYSSYFGASPPDAYERLICDCMSGDGILFARVDEVIASWRLFTPILEYWKETAAPHFPNYSSGTWGPKEADQMLAKEGRQWRHL